jgi:hypothetical protein
MIYVFQGFLRDETASHPCCFVIDEPILRDPGDDIPVLKDGEYWCRFRAVGLVPDNAAVLMGADRDHALSQCLDALNELVAARSYELLDGRSQPVRLTIACFSVLR